MITPNKVVTLAQSAMAKAPRILEVGPAPISLPALYRATATKFESIDEFMLTIDLLYILERIDLNSDGWVLYVD